MRQRLLMLLVLPLIALPMSASGDWMDDFDSYALGSGLHGQGGWQGWDGDATWDAYVTDVESHSAPHSVEITANSDIVQQFSGYSSGKWVFTAWQFVPSSFSGRSYCILLNTYGPGGPYNWSTQIAFDGAGFVESEFDEVTLPLVTGQWVELRVEIDLDADTQTIYYNGDLLIVKSWTEGLTGGGEVNIAALDLFANGATPIYYDDLSLLPDMPTAVERSTWGAIKNSFK